ncbi:MAG: hypothetical protein J5944_12255 [Lentisphaeria bacterium]|nr:hypothetical protein [Lentisphaeria bacterium]
MKKLLLPGCVLVLVLAGCCSGDGALEKQNAELKRQNEEILSQLRKLHGRVADLEKRFSSFRVPHVQADWSRFKKVKPLPPNPTDAQIVAYLREIADFSDGQRAMGPSDPQVTLFRKIGPGHLKLLLPFLKDRQSKGSLWIRSYLRHALPSLVTVEDIPFIKANIVSTPELLCAVTSMEFAKPMKQEIFETIRKSPSYLSVDYRPEFERLMAELVETPQDRKAIEEIYIDNFYRDGLLNVLLKIPGCNVGEVTVRAWRKVSREEERQVLLYREALAAVRYGHDVSACKYLLKLIMTPARPNDMVPRIARETLMRLSDFPVYDRERLLLWYEKNHARIVFDEKSGKFVLKKQD